MNAGCTTVINDFNPYALNLKFQHFIPIFKKKNHSFVTMSLELERGLGDERKVPSRVKTRSLYEKL
jgi:hypothetical protein